MALAGESGNYVQGVSPEAQQQAFDYNQQAILNQSLAPLTGGGLSGLSNFAGIGMNAANPTGYGQYGFGSMLQNLGGFGATSPSGGAFGGFTPTDPTGQESQFSPAQQVQQAQQGGTSGLSFQQVAANAQANTPGSQEQADASAAAQGKPPPGPTATPGGGATRGIAPFGSGYTGLGGNEGANPNSPLTKFIQQRDQAAGKGDLEGGAPGLTPEQRQDLLQQGREALQQATPQEISTGGRQGAPAAPPPDTTPARSDKGGDEDQRPLPPGAVRQAPPGYIPMQGQGGPLTQAMGGPQALQQFLANALRGAIGGGMPPWMMRGRNVRGMPPWMRGGRGPYGMMPGMRPMPGRFGGPGPYGQMGGRPPWMRPPGMGGPMGPGQQGTQPGVPPGAPGGPSPERAAPSWPTSPVGVPSQGLMQGVKHFEHFSPKSYWDGDHWSVGYGTYARFPGERIDQQEGERRLKVELGMAGAQVDKIVPSNTPQNVRDALTSFTFNVGDGWIRKRGFVGEAGAGNTMADHVAAGNWRAAAQDMQAFVRSNGQVVSGLVTRRRAEAEYMLMPPRSTAGNAPTQGNNAPGTYGGQVTQI
jgi:GH24 family phage-related lysozyme (muramidase)